MQRAHSPAQHPALFPLGTLVGPWRIVAWAGRGVYGAVYQAVRVGEEHPAPVALKVALLAMDPRFVREAALLSLTRHPSIPRLIDTGDWQHPSGSLHPYLAMEWIDGAPLYDWAWQHNPTSQQVLRLLAQLARALAAVHAQGAVHRDVKGDNVMVRRTDSRAMLTDFGTGKHPGASTLTPRDVFPGTPAYRAPEAWLFALRFGRNAQAAYCAEPADDVFSLGVTGYRLLTGEYPPLGEPRQDAAGTWQLEDVAPPAPHLLNPRVDPRLSALILRMISVRPEQRGTAQELAETLELAAQHALPESAQPIFAPQPLPPSDGPREEAAAASESNTRWRLDEGDEVRPPEPRQPAAMALVLEGSSGAAGSAASVRPRAHAGRGLAVAAVSLTLVAGVWWAAPGKSQEKPFVVQREANEAAQADGDTVGLGEAAVAASTEDSTRPSGRKVLAEDTLPKPLPRQTRPDSKGHCPYMGQFAINGGCWVETSLEHEGCEQLNGQMFKGRCYVPFMEPERQPTSSPSHPP